VTPLPNAAFQLTSHRSQKRTAMSLSCACRDHKNSSCMGWRHVRLLFRSTTATVQFENFERHQTNQHSVEPLHYSPPYKDFPSSKTWTSQTVFFIISLNYPLYKDTPTSHRSIKTWFLCICFRSLLRDSTTFLHLNSGSACLKSESANTSRELLETYQMCECRSRSLGIPDIGS